VLAVVVHAPAGPGSGEDLQRFIEHLAAPPVIELLAGRRQLAAEMVAAQADAEGEAAAAEPVQRHGLPGDFGRPPAGQRRDHGAQPHALRGGGGCRQGDPRVGQLPHRRPPGQVIPEKDPVPAGLLGLGGQPGDHHRVSEIAEGRHPQRRPQPGGGRLRPVRRARTGPGTSGGGSGPSCPRAGGGMPGIVWQVIGHDTHAKPGEAL